MTAAGVVATEQSSLLLLTSCFTCFSELQPLHFRGNTACGDLQVLMNEGIDRRRRFISTVACALGIGVIINPGWATDNLWNTYDGMSTGKRAIRYIQQRLPGKSCFASCLSRYFQASRLPL